LLDAAEVGAGTRVLDLATGPGYVAASAAKRDAVAVGIDVAGSMVELARELHPEVEFRQASAVELPFEDETFDAVVGNFMILHVGEPERAASEAVRVLKTPGRIALSTWDVPDRARLFWVVLAAIEDAEATAPMDIPMGPSIFRFSSEPEFNSLLEGAGFGDIEVQTVEFTHTFESGTLVWDGIVEGTVRTRALVMAQDEDVQRRIRNAFEARIREFASNGGVELPISVKIASGQKAAA
jgi:SAM-dependent methyltransferase